MAALLQVSYAIHGRPPEGDFKPPQAADFAVTTLPPTFRLPRGSRTPGRASPAMWECDCMNKTSGKFPAV